MAPLFVVNVNCARPTVDTANKNRRASIFIPTYSNPLPLPKQATF